MQQDNSSFWTDIKTFEEQLATSPNSFCFARLSEVYLKVGLVDDALHTARQGVAKYPRYLSGQRALAMACHAKGLNDECVVALKLVTEALPEDLHAQKLLGRILAASGDQDAARRAFQTVLEFVPDDVECRSELESLEFSSGAAASLPLMDEGDQEEIIEDLEIIDEIDIFEEDQPVSEVGIQESPCVVEPTGEPHHDPLSTGTLAELYVKQGFIHKALEIYRSILADDPANSVVSTRIKELELQDTAVESALPDDDVFACEPDEVPATAYEMDTPLQSSAFAVQPAPRAVTRIPEQEETFFAAPAENVSAVLHPQGIADNALAIFEGWLENIRRIKSCR